jgi:WD40 repeat protein
MAKLLPLLFLLLALASSCKRDAPDDPQPAITTTIVLDPPLLVNDSTATLTWSALNNPDFVSYQVVRKEDPTETGTTFRVFGTIADVTYRDRSLPYTDYVQYQIIGTLASGQTISSNIATCRRPQIKTVSGLLTDVQFDSQTRLLYIFGRDGTIQQYDVATNQSLRTIQVGQAIGHCSFGTFGGVKELYVPCNDGRVFIYNATTLAKMDELMTIASPLTDVLASNNQLFVAATYYNGNPLRTFDRATKAPLSNISGVANRDMRLFKVPGTTTEFIGVALSVAPTPQTYFTYSTAGLYVRELNFPFQSNRSLSPSAFEFFPAGDRYITGAYGDVFTRTMGYLAALPYRTDPLNRRQEYTCFSFDDAAQTIYAGTTTRSIEVISMNGYTPVRSIKTRLYPYKLFRDGTGFLSVSLPVPVENYFYGTTLYRAKMLIEHIN